MDVKNILKHIIYFSKTLPSRGSTTENEKKASVYCFNKLKEAGCNPKYQYFESARSAYLPAFVYAMGILVSLIFFVFYYHESVALISFVLILVCIVSMLSDAAFKKNLLSFLLPKGKSQNVIAEIPPLYGSKQHLVLIGHIDSHRTPLLFSTLRWVYVLKLLVPLSILITILSLVYMIFIFFGFPFPLEFLILPICFFIFLAAVMVQADFTPYTAGTNDNASGAAAVLECAAYYQKNLLKNTTLHIVFSGCEEVGAYGARAFAEGYKRKIPGAFWFTIDGVGAEGAVPSILASEVFFKEVKSDSKLLEIAKRIMKDNPDLEAFILPKYQGAYTDSSPGGLNGFKVVSLLALKKDGTLPVWHTMQDTFENIDNKTLNSCVLFIEKFIKEVDTNESI